MVSRAHGGMFGNIIFGGGIGCKRSFTTLWLESRWTESDELRLAAGKNLSPHVDPI
jgi:hypothetical protein